MRFSKIKQAFFTLLALCLTLSFALCVRGVNVSKLQKTQGKRIFYLHSPSAWATQTEHLKISDILHVQGESVSFSFQGTNAQTLALVQNILQEYQAEIVQREYVNGIACYYAYAPYLYKGICIDGKIVNLHIAIGQGRATVGTPMIFGGF